MGQRYGDPYEAVMAGSDCIIVGSGIHGSSDVQLPLHMQKLRGKHYWSDERGAFLFLVGLFCLQVFALLYWGWNA